MNDSGTLSIMYHRFDEHKYPSTNIDMEVFKKQIQIIKNNKLNFYIPDKFEKEFKKKKKTKKKFC